MVRFNVPLAALALLAGCSNIKPDDFGPGDPHDTSSTNGGDTDTDTDGDTDADTDSDTDTDTSGGNGGDSDTATTDTGDTGVIDLGDTEFDDPGDVVAYTADEDGLVDVDLTDASGDSNRSQEYYYIAVNTTTTNLGYRLRYYPSSSSAGPTSSQSLPRVLPRPQRAPPAYAPVTSPPPPPVSEIDIGTASQEFLVRTDLSDESEFATVAGTLWALGDNVAIWVDDDVAIDYDRECDGVIDVPSSRPSFGFDNCDLNQMAQIVDANIIPNLQEFFGDMSDINGDGRVAVLITPVLNTITLSSSSDIDHYRALQSYAEPSVDLREFDDRTNPGSDGEEVIYVYAPDPYGFYNPYAQPTVDSFTSYQLAGEIARSLTALTSYNQHVLLSDGENPVEEDWVNDTMGTLAADLCGFGAAYYVDAWEYVDAPNLHPLVLDGVSGDLGTLSRGAQYLFGRWLYDRAEAESSGSGVAMLQSIMQSGATGTDSIEAATGEDFASLVVQWQVALLTDGVVTGAGDPILDPADWPAYAAPTTVVAPPDSAANLYGANGYQRGIELNGLNRAYSGGTTDTPAELVTFRVRLEHQDSWIYTPGFEFDGYVKGGYAADVVRLTGITYDAARMQVQATATGLVGAVIRWNDPVTSDYTVEDVYSVTDANPIALPTLPTDGSHIHGVGQIYGTADVTVYDPSGDDSVVTAYDTDRWLLDLSGRAPSESVSVAVWLKRNFSDTSGNSGPSDPWLAVVPQDWLPEPTVDSVHTNTSCDGAPAFEYPRSLLEYLFRQQILAHSLTGTSDGSGDYCGSVDPSAVCATDWDLDGVLDSDEPTPSTLYGQILTQQCQLNDGVLPGTGSRYSLDWADTDEQDSDDIYSRNLVYNTGGRAGQNGEEAYVEVTLQGGEQYLIVVADNDTSGGTYQLSIRELTN